MNKATFVYIYIEDAWIHLDSGKYFHKSQHKDTAKAMLDYLGIVDTTNTRLEWLTDAYNITVRLTW